MNHIMSESMSKRFLTAAAVTGLLITMFAFVQSSVFALDEEQSSAGGLAPGDGDGPVDSSLNCEGDGIREVVACYGSRFSTTMMYSDGTYEIDWTEWDGENSDVEGYTVMRLRLLHRTFVGDVGQDEDLLNQTHFKPGSCVPGRPWRDEPGDYVWRCRGVANAFETPSGSPTSLEILVENSVATSYSGSLDMRGQRTKDIDVIQLPVPAPTSWGSVPNEVVVQQAVIETEIHLIYIAVNFTDDSNRYFTASANSVSGFGPQN